MPLDEILPVIDDRSYADIVAEARSRVPRYTPEWTDLNESDPGMILVELFAWLTEMQIFRMNQVPELNYLKFLDLVGIELTPPRPATTRIGFPVSGTAAEATVIVPALTQVAAEEVEGGPIVFELDQAVVAIRSQLDAIQVFDGFRHREIVTSEGADAVFAPFGSFAGVGSRLLLGFSEELPAESFALTFFSGEEEEEYPVSSCVTEASRAALAGTLVWTYWDGAAWQPLTLLGDDSFALTRTGEVTLRGPATGSMQPAVLEEVAESLFWIRVEVAQANYQTPPSLMAIRTNTGTATQAETIEFETVGGSNGEVGQEFQLAAAPVIPGSLLLEVNEGAGYESWTEVQDFNGSDQESKHFTLNQSTGVIRFGGETHVGGVRRGRVPVANSRAPANIRARSYRVGGGARGNVGAGSLTALLDPLEGIDADGVTNAAAAGGGTDEESVAAARERAPIELKSRDRAVTGEDFELLAKQAANVRRARARELHHPDFPDVEVPGVVTVIVIPDLDDPAPVPTEATLAAVCAHLNERRLLTTEVFVTGPTYETVTVTAELVVDDTADLAAVKERALDDLALYFHPLRGGDDSDPDALGDESGDGSGWPFGGDVRFSRLYARLLRSDVRHIARLEIALDSEEFGECQDARVPEGALLRSGDHVISVRYESDDEGGA